MKGPLIVQSDHTLLLEVDHPDYAACRDFLALFAELVKSPEFIHTYRINPLSLWNAAALEIPLPELLDGLKRFSRYELPTSVLTDIHEWYSAYGKLVLEPHTPDTLRLTVHEPALVHRLRQDERLQPYWRDAEQFLIDASQRGQLKQSLVKVGFPVKDLCGYQEGTRHPLALREYTADQQPFALRDYQRDAVSTYYQAGRETGGSGVIVLPCGAGKTIIGLGVMSQIGAYTLIITTNNVSVHQWRDELLNRTSALPEDIGEFTGLDKQIRPITITTYQMLTHRPSRADDFPNLNLFTVHDWGLIIYDEVHLLPAPIFRATASLQARRRLGLTATLVREDNLQDEVFALIGPKRYDVPWKVLEQKGFIAQAICTEYRLPLTPEEERQYAYADKRARYRIAAENSRKTELARMLIDKHPDDPILVIGQYLDQLKLIAEELDAPLITGSTPHQQREQLYNRFKQGELRILIVSKVANFAIDLPDANVMIQISGMFGSRQEEAQRLGRILRPKQRNAYFYTLVSKGTDEQSFGQNRQLFLVEQGYRYQICYYE